MDAKGVLSFSALPQRIPSRFDLSNTSASISIGANMVNRAIGFRKARRRRTRHAAFHFRC
jgi:hypothetical protein